MISYYSYSGLLHQCLAGFSAVGVSASLGVFACATVFGWITPILPHLLGPDSETPMTSEEASWMITMPESLLFAAVGVSASLGVFACATVFGWITPILPHLLGPDSETPMTSEEASWMITMPEFGNLISPLPAGYIADRFGRKIVILSCAPIFFIGWVIILYFKTIMAMSIARFIQGLAVGIIYTVIPMYLGEIASPKYRGAITSLFYCLWWFGFLFEYVVGTALSYFYFTCVSASINVVFFLAFIWQPESPYYYLMKSDHKRAKISLSWFRNTLNDETMKELENMTLCIQEDQSKNVSWNELVATPADRKVLLIIAIIVSLRQFTGLIPLSVYSTQTLSTVGDNLFISPDNVTIVMGGFMFIGSIFSSFTLDIFGRKSLLVVSCSVSAVSMFSAGTFYLLKSHSSFVNSYWDWVPAVAIFLLSGISVVGTFPVSIAYVSELFTSNTRGVASAFSSVYSTILGVFILRFYMTLLNMFGAFVNFYIFATFGLLGTFVSCFLMPETKGKSFSEIRHEIENKNKIIV